MQENCWGFNDIEDCAWVIFSYGSRWDMLSHVYKKGFRLSLKALKIFIYYDYEINEVFCESDVPWHEMSLEEQMQSSYLSIIHPNALEWFKECLPVSGGFQRDNPNYSEYYPNIVSTNSEKVYSNIPSLERGIPQFNQDHHDLIKRVYENNNDAMVEAGEMLTWYGVVTPDEYENNQASFEDLKDI